MEKLFAIGPQLYNEKKICYGCFKEPRKGDENGR